jgi:hypothetical protein
MAPKDEIMEQKGRFAKKESLEQLPSAVGRLA